MRKRHWIGLILWRGGLLLAGGWAAFRSLRFALQFIEMPVEIEIGLALLLAGLVFVLVSLVQENVADARQPEVESRRVSGMIRATRWVGFALAISGIVVLLWYLLAKIWEPLREVLPWWRRLDGPIQYGLAAAALGLLILVTSVVAERLQDWKRENKEPEGRY